MVAGIFVQSRVSADTESALPAAAQEQGFTESLIVKRLLQSPLSGAHISDETILRQGAHCARTSPARRPCNMTSLR